MYNAEKWIQSTINFAINQEHLLELIVVDDGSYDQSRRIVQNLLPKYPKLKLYWHNENKGPGAARNFGILLAQGEYISFLDADDAMLDNRFVSPIEILQSMPEIDGVYSILKDVKEDLSNLDNQSSVYLSLEDQVNPNKLFEYVIGENKKYFSICGLVLRRAKMDANMHASLFDEKFKVGEDLDFSYKVALSMALVKDINENPVILRRLHNLNISLHHDSIQTRYLLAKKWFYTIQSHQYSKKEIIAMVKNYFFREHDIKGNSLTKPLPKVFYFIIFLFKNSWLLIHFIKAPHAMNRFKKLI
jgi:glycosyltransferase involved in cell wall biosynthesis